MISVGEQSGTHGKNCSTASAAAYENESQTQYMGFMTFASGTGHDTDNGAGGRFYCRFYIYCRYLKLGISW